jgi:hypothetical protein
VPITNPSPGPSTRFVGSYRSQITLAENRTGTVELTTRRDGTASGTLTVRSSARTVIGIAPVAGSVNTSTGFVDLSGTFTENGQSGPVRFRATLPGGTAPSGGPAAGTGTLQIGGASFSGAVTAGTGSPSPSPSASPSANPSPSPSPSTSPSPGTGDLGSSFFRAYSSDDRLTFRETTTTRTNGVITFGPEVRDVISAGDFFTDGRQGAETQVSLNGATVTRREVLDDQNRRTGYVYYTRTATAYRYYGSDDFDAAGQVETETRVSPAVEFPLRPEKGRTYEQNPTVTVRDVAENVTSTFTYNYRFTYEADEARTVPAGTFNTARVRVRLAFSTATGGVNLNTVNESVSWAAPEVGSVESHNVLTMTGLPTGDTQTVIDSVLKSARVNGRNYP